MDWLWVRLTPDGSDVVDSGTNVEALLAPDPPVAWTLTQDLSVLNGPIATPAGDLFTTTAGIGGVTREPLPAGQTILVTLSLTISAEPGTYHLTLTDAEFLNTAYVASPATTGVPLEIVIQGNNSDGSCAVVAAMISQSSCC